VWHLLKAAPEGVNVASYEEGRQRLIAYVRRLNESRWNWTQHQQEIDGLANRLERVLHELEDTSSVTFDIECEHDKPLPTETGFDGLPINPPDWRSSYQATLLHMRDLVDSARRASAAFPNSRERFALPRAATGLVWLLYEHNKQPPKLYVNGPAVKELKSICEAAGLQKEIESYRGALKKATGEFDRHMTPVWLHQAGIV
jgi:hypothetical protein